MNWIFLALLAPALDAVITFIDKYLVEHKVKDSRCMPIFSGIGSIIFTTPIWLIAGAHTLSLHNGLLVIAAGAFTLAGFPLYYSALTKSHASYINALFQTTPIFILVISSVLLREHLLWVQLLGFVLVLSAVMGLSIDKVERKIKLDRSFWEILLANVFFAISAILIKFTTDLTGFIPILTYSSWGLAVGAALLFAFSKKIRASFFATFRDTGKSTLAIVLGNESLTAFSQAIYFLAISLGPVALVSVLGGTQVFFSIVIGAVLTMLFPKIFHEDIEKKELAIKIALSLVMLAGIAFIGGDS